MVGFYLEAPELFSIAIHAVSLYDNFHITPCVEVSWLRSSLRVFFSANSQVFIDIFFHFQLSAESDMLMINTWEIGI